MFLVLFSGSARAQLCDTAKIMIFEMFEPEMASYNLWDTVYGGVDSEEHFVSAVYAEGMGVVAAGEFRSSPDAEPSLLLVNIDYRGRVVWEHKYAIEGLIEVKNVLSYRSGYLVMGNANYRAKNNTRYNQIWLGFFDAEGALESERLISEDEADVIAQDIISMVHDNTYLLASSVQRSNENENTYAQIYMIDDSGKVKSKRAFLLGTENKILSLALMPSGAIAAGGYVYGEGGRKHGWLLMLDAQGRMDWERQYPRGRGAMFSSVVAYQNGLGLLVSGNAQPTLDRGRYDGTMVMMLDPSGGDIMWERYYTGSRHYRAVDAFAHSDGLMSIALNAVNVEGSSKIVDGSRLELGNGDSSGRYDFVRVLTLDPRGVSLGSQDYFNAQGVRVYQMLDGKDQSTRLLVGGTQVKETIEGVAGLSAEVKSSGEGWLIAVPQAAPYKDVCAAIQ